MANYRHNWRGTVVSSILEPLLFLTAMGVGLGTLVDSAGRLAGDATYLQFLAPGLLAATAMQVGTMESTYPVMGAIKWHRTFYAMLDTPLGIGSLVIGQQLFVLFRLATTCLVYLVVIALFGALATPWGILAWPAAVLTGMAFTAPITAFAATRDNDAGFAALFRFGIVPMFLFSGTFFPIEQLPDVLEPVAYLVPLWHGVDLCRSLALGTAEWGMTVVHVAYLGCWVVAGVLLSRAAFRRRLVK